MKIKYFFPLLALLLFGCAKENKGYVNIVGTRLSIIPPEGFKQADNFTGLKKNDVVGIQVMDIVGGNYDSGEKTFAKEAFEQKGMKMLKFEDLKIDGFKAKFMHAKNPDGAESMMLLFGDSTFVATVMTVFPGIMSLALSDDIEQSLKGIRYDKKRKVDPLARAFFKTEANTSKFKFAKTGGNIFMYSENGVALDSYEGHPMALISPMPFDKSMTKEAVFENLLGGLQQNGIVIEKMDGVSKTPINGYDAMQAVFYFNHKGKDKMGMVAVLINGDKTLAFHGSADSDFAGNLAEFNKLLRSLRFK